MGDEVPYSNTMRNLNLFCSCPNPLFPIVISFFFRDRQGSGIKKPFLAIVHYFFHEVLPLFFQTFFHTLCPCSV